MKLIICIAICFSMSACFDYGLQDVGFEIVKYPDKLFYVIGVDKELNLDGGTVHVITAQNKNKPEKRVEEQMKDFEYELKHDIDFNTEGIYIVNIVLVTGYSVSFPIQVVSLENVKKIVASEIE